MELYLVRHGQAKRADEDPERGLTELGVRQAEGTARWIGERGAKVRQIRHSGKKRAQQTAEIFARYLDPPGGAVPAPGLSPNDDVVPVSDQLVPETGALVFVGHLPFLPRLASMLVAGDPERVGFGLAEAGVLCLVRREGRWYVRWMVTPREVGVRE